MKNNLLKKLAEKAKNRMLGRENKPKDVCIKTIDFDSDDFIVRAKEAYMMSESGVIVNPIKMLMNEKVLIGLDEGGRERYLLQTVERYLKFKNSFEKSRVWEK